MQAFKGEKFGLEGNATVNRKPLQLLEHRHDMVSFRSHQYDTCTSTLNTS